MKHFLEIPFPLSTNLKTNLKNNVIVGTIVFLILFLFQPFGINLISAHLKLPLAIGYGLITFLVASIFNILLPKLFPKVFNDLKWNIGKEILNVVLLVISISFGNLAITALLPNSKISALFILNMLYYTIVIGIAPIIITIIIKQQLLLKKYKQQATQIQETFETNTLTVETAQAAIVEKEQYLPKPITILGSNANETLTILSIQFLFAVAADNYCQIYYKENEQLKHVLYRTTIKKIEESTANYPSIFRSHKSYLINLQHVAQISGNAQGYKLHLADFAEPIPVSRSFNNIIQNKLTTAKCA